MILSILIPTMPSREKLFNKLYSDLAYQIHNIPHGDDLVEILEDNDMSVNIGTKRNRMLKKAAGTFVVFIDDDDTVAPYYIRKILDAIEQNPHIDCIGMRGKVSFDGGEPKPWSISITHKEWYEKDGVYYRTPNHISPVRTDIASKVGFPNIAFGEDAEYSRNIYPLLKHEYYIDSDMYHYKFITNK